MKYDKYKITLLVCIVTSSVIFSSVNAAGSTEEMLNNSRKQYNNSNIPDISSVSISEDVFVSERFKYLGKGETVHGIVGIFSALAGIGVFTQPAEEEAKQQTDYKYARPIYESFQESELELDKLLYDEFINRLKDANVFTISHKSKPDAEFLLNLGPHGMSIVHHATNQLRPYMHVYVKLVSNDGTVLWNTRASSSPKNEQINVHFYDEYKNNSELFKEEFLNVINYVLEEIITDLQKHVN